ncbi:hypothetical protein RyT2_01120 [Pseudolactococcus yaeyamensis]
MTNTTLNNVAGLNNFPSLTEDEMTMVEGGVVPLIVIGGIAISKGAAIAGGLFLTGIGVGYFLSK